jgi:hypothetical protein
MSKILTTLSPAVEADLPTLAQINTAADQDQAVVFPFFFHDCSPASLLQFFLHRLTASFHNPTTQIIKATDVENGEIVAFVCMTQVGPNEEGRAANNIPTPYSVNLEFAVPMQQNLAKLMEVMDGREHFSTFCLLCK